MKKKVFRIIFGLLVGMVALFGFGQAASATSNAMYRLYNANTGEHFYTASTEERDGLVPLGWQYEGVGWNAPTTGDEVYRLFNPNSDDHHYTLSTAERDNLVQLGWQYEGVGWFSDVNQAVPLYRLFNPNEMTATHHYTTSQTERDNLTQLGWKAEGIAWYGTNEPVSTTLTSLDEAESYLLQLWPHVEFFINGQVLADGSYQFDYPMAYSYESAIYHRVVINQNRQIISNQFIERLSNQDGSLGNPVTEMQAPALAIVLHNELGRPDATLESTILTKKGYVVTYQTASLVVYRYFVAFDGTVTDGIPTNI